VTPPIHTKPFRVVLRWQLIATATVAAIALIFSGGSAAVSAMLGGIVNVAAGVAYAWLLGFRLGAAGVPDAASSLLAMFRAEAGKFLVIIGGLWLALSTYKDMVPVAFFTAFVITVIVFSMAFFVRD
jgi:F0F1-type ATP synthase assembly protein I